MAQSPPILRGGFRPFFFGAAVWALVALMLWLAILFGLISPQLTDDPLAWHRHEMLFGFAGAAIAGFALTAVPNWTGRLPIAGGALAGLFGLWLAGRAAWLVLPEHPLIAASFDSGFYLVLAAFLAREILLSRNRNIPIVAIIAFFGIADLVDCLETNGIVDLGSIGWRAGLALIVLMIALVGGRIVPSFTRNWLASQGASDPMPTQPGRFDLGTLLIAGIALLCWVVSLSSPVSGWLLLAAGAAHTMRLIRWQGWRCVSNTLVLILHLGYAWLAAGLSLLGAASVGLVAETVAIHALTTGAIGTMILAVMTRATRGHTGRPLVASGTTKLCYALITCAAIARVLAGLTFSSPHALMAVAGMAWCAAFALFLVEYGPMLWSSRVDERPEPKA